MNLMAWSCNESAVCPYKYNLYYIYCYKTVLEPQFYIPTCVGALLIYMKPDSIIFYTIIIGIYIVIVKFNMWLNIGLYTQHIGMFEINI